MSLDHTMGHSLGERFNHWSHWREFLRQRLGHLLRLRLIAKLWCGSQLHFLKDPVLFSWGSSRSRVDGNVAHILTKTSHVLEHLRKAGSAAGLQHSILRSLSRILWRKSAILFGLIVLSHGCQFAGENSASRVLVFDGLLSELVVLVLLDVHWVEAASA